MANFTVANCFTDSTSWNGHDAAFSDVYSSIYVSSTSLIGHGAALKFPVLLLIWLAWWSSHGSGKSRSFVRFRENEYERSSIDRSSKSPALWGNNDLQRIVFKKNCKSVHFPAQRLQGLKFPATFYGSEMKECNHRNSECRKEEGQKLIQGTVRKAVRHTHCKSCGLDLF